MSGQGGLLVAPAAPALLRLSDDPEYRQALQYADIVLPDSAFMVLSWRLLKHERLRRISGLAYLRALLQNPAFRRPGQTLWVMASPVSAKRNIAWLKTQGLRVRARNVYVAPQFRGMPEDSRLLQLLDQRRVRHVVLTLGGGVQEKLGSYLKQNLTYTPAIHCIGGAIGMLSGDQVRIPRWVDRACLGWLLRCIAHPSQFVPRYTSAFALFSMLRRYGELLPSLHSNVESSRPRCSSASSSGAQVSY